MAFGKRKAWEASAIRRTTGSKKRGPVALDHEVIDVHDAAAGVVVEDVDQPERPAEVDTTVNQLAVIEHLERILRTIGFDAHALVYTRHILGHRIRARREVMD